MTTSPVQCGATTPHPAHDYRFDQTDTSLLHCEGVCDCLGAAKGHRPGATPACWQAPSTGKCRIPHPHAAHPWNPHTPEAPDLQLHCEGVPLQSPVGEDHYRASLAATAPARRAPCGSSQPHGAHTAGFPETGTYGTCPGLAGKAEDETERKLRQLRADLDTALADIAVLKAKHDRHMKVLKDLLTALEKAFG